jgi:hypothetical protein
MELKIRNAFYFLLLLPLSLFAQEKPYWSIEGSFSAGRIVRHTPKFDFDIPEISSGTLISFQHQTHGKKGWQRRQQYPRFGLLLGFFHFGSEQLGQAISLAPNISVDVFRKERSSLQFQLSVGFSCLNRPYDRLARPNNNAIGSFINNFTAFQFLWLRELGENLDLSTGIQMVHFSNGAIQLPNLGYNIPMASLGLRYHLRGRFEDFAPLLPEERKPDRRWGGQAYSYFALREVAAIGGSKYPVWGASAAVHYHTAKDNRFLLGVEYEYQQAVYAFETHHELVTSEKDIRRGAERYMIFAGHEFLYGPWSVSLNAGTYLNKSSTLLLPFPFFTKLGIRYYISPFGETGPRIQTGLYLKAHRTVAEYFAFGLGLSY